jgi:hypothetical protein
MTTQSETVNTVNTSMRAQAAALGLDPNREYWYALAAQLPVRVPTRPGRCASWHQAGPIPRGRCARQPARTMRRSACAKHEAAVLLPRAPVVAREPPRKPGEHAVRVMTRHDAHHRNHHPTIHRSSTRRCTLPRAVPPEAAATRAGTRQRRRSTTPAARTTRRLALPRQQHSKRQGAAHGWICDRSSAALPAGIDSASRTHAARLPASSGRAARAVQAALRLSRGGETRLGTP